MLDLVPERPLLWLINAPAKDAGPILRIDGVDKRFTTGAGEIEALRSVHLAISRREFICLIGPSGCGKSTLLRMIGGFEVPSVGQVLMNGEPVAGPGRDRGMVFQGYGLFPWLSFRPNIGFGPAARGLPRPGWTWRWRQVWPLRSAISTALLLRNSWSPILGLIRASGSRAKALPTTAGSPSRDAVMPAECSSRRPGPRLGRLDRCAPSFFESPRDEGSMSPQLPRHASWRPLPGTCCAGAKTTSGSDLRYMRVSCANLSCDPAARRVAVSGERRASTISLMRELKTGGASSGQSDHMSGSSADGNRTDGVIIRSARQPD